MDQLSILFFLACAFGFFMAWGIGANDVANAMGASVGSRALTIKQAIIIAAIFEAAGALLAGGEVTDTIRGKIIDMNYFTGASEVLIYGMLAALLAAGTWLLIASYFGWPVSTTHSIVGALIGFGVVYLGVQAIHWDKTLEIMLSWVLTPVLSGLIAYTLFHSIRWLILASNTPLDSAKKYMPMYVFMVAYIISLVTFGKGLAHLGLNLSFLQVQLASLSISALCIVIGVLGVYHIKPTTVLDKKHDYVAVEKVFGFLMIFTACAMAFAHGSNDVANAIGPLAAVIGLIQEGSNVAMKSAVPFWVLALGAIGIVTGLVMFGHRVIATIGSNITVLTPSRGFAATLATASTVVIASGTGLPISTTQTLVGAVLGVGLAGGISAIRLNVVRNIFISWAVTLPAGAVLAIIFFFVLRLIFG